MYTTYATSILQLKIKSGSKYGAENHRKLMAAPRPTFQQFVDYLRGILLKSSKIAKSKAC